MTMRIAKGQQIGGFAAKDVRDMLRRCDGGFRADWVEDELFKRWCKQEFGRYNRYFETSPTKSQHRTVCSRESARLVQALLTEGVILRDEERTKGEPSRPAWYKLTDHGESFCRATTAKPIHRQDAEDALKEFMERVRIVNEDARFLYRVAAVVVFGSYVRGADRLGDIDLGVQTERKIDDHEEFEKACEEYVKGRSLGFLGALFAPERDVRTFLRQRKRALSLHHMSELVRMAKDSPEKLGSYEVLFGDRDKIAQDLQRAE